MRCMTGSSPRGRGTRRSHIAGAPQHRFIPARAGNTLSPHARHAPPAVHPRAGGEHLPPSSPAAFFIGSSPRGRGTPDATLAQLVPRRFIPARAGNTGCAWSPARPHAVHPRAGGEHSGSGVPGGWGRGSSPRGRGTLVSLADIGSQTRFIPARAGNTGQIDAFPLPSPVHPRAGGEHSCAAACSAASCGSSPRGRGTRYLMTAWHGSPRFIPARAGNTCPAPSPGEPTSVHPRAGGEHT